MLAIFPTVVFDNVDRDLLAIAKFLAHFPVAAVAARST